MYTLLDRPVEKHLVNACSNPFKTTYDLGRTMRKISQEDREKQLDTLLAGTPFTFVKWFDKFQNNKSKVTLNCPIHGDWSTGFSNVVKGTRCAKCRTDSQRHTGFDTALKIKNTLKTGQTFIGFDGEYMNNKTRAIIECDKHGQWSSSSLHVLHSGVNCAKCSSYGVGRKRATPIVELMNRFNDLDTYKFVRFESEYMNSSSKVVMSCPEHGEWVTQVQIASSGKHKCPSCVKYGYDPQLTGYVYLIKSECSRFFKVGITNNIRRRFVELKRSTPFEIVKISHFKCDGWLAVEIEKSFHAHFNSAKMKGFNGSSEWYHWNGDVVDWFKLL